MPLRTNNTHNRGKSILKTTDVPQILEALKVGMSFENIGAKFGVGGPAIRSYLKRKKLSYTRPPLLFDTYSKNPAVNVLAQRYRAKAKQRGIDFNLTIEYFETITSQPCHYCGVNPFKKVVGYFRPQHTHMFNGIDRVDSSKGYNVDNCVPCCYKCNYAKGEMSVAEFKEHIERLYLTFVTRYSNVA